ncbi:MAG: undecaprenyl-diphosphate phosphatase [Paludibacter sp.]|nr:undecaprenyl-diphosphate phosphatase [Bacteroidales bacterium]MCM1069578.1 undecaprenyl-diphosphate phosphatase [Prevotella sp.]MCM1354224.1 undecaprenyl-diphosphate phosphatase [Bacteroides sp.]MCM1443037.1 undecaprenyl-diphosphate phosphatase [Muribaculum sp.]MCM1482298.1 undecaprenyl-diphosphate phosphatase [Paludibacter sp.]
MSWFEALILGIVQGLTEFLPVSSSGHLEIGHYLLGTSGEENLTFAIVVHTATVLSTLVVLWKEVAWILRGTFTTVQWNKEKDYAAKILLSMIPVFIVGMFFKETIEQFFGNGLLLVGICLLITAFLLFISEWITKKRERLSQNTETGEVGKEISYSDAFIIGCAQAVAVLPGLSRSGTTIATGLLCGVKKSAVAQFSFLMVLIPILGEAFLDLLKYLQEPTVVSSIPAASLVVGFFAAFFTGCFACRFMIEIVRKQKLIWFSLYCLIVGMVAILGTLIG